MTWLHNGQELLEMPSGKPEGFVYRITNTVSGKQYIGKKSFWMTKTYQLKGKTKRKMVESNWKEYFGSNEPLQKDVDTLGRENFIREVLTICATKALCSYHEARLQFVEDVLLKPELYYNNWIMVRVRGPHVAGK